MLKTSKKIVAISLVMVLAFTPLLTRALADDLAALTEDIENKLVEEPSGEPGEPGDPTEPGGPAEPTEPGEPAKPTYPGEPTEPGDPAEPTEPGEPAKPTYPGEPTEPGDPAEPTEPGEPAEPGDPAGPTEPGEPTEPGDPAEPTEPGEPAEPTEPEEPGGPVDPMEPAEPAGPENPQVPAELPPEIPVEPPLPETNPALSVSITTDRELYSTGDTIFYDVFTINTGDVEVETVTAYVYSSLGKASKTLSTLSPGQEASFSDEIYIDDDFDETFLEIKVKAEGWFGQTRVLATKSLIVEIEPNPFIELKTPPGINPADLSRAFRSLERTNPDFGPPREVFLPELVKSAGTQDTIGVDKNASFSGICRSFDVELKITGEPAPAPVDVVLVIDRSGSMDAKYKGKTIMTYAKDAAKLFTDKVLSDSNNRVAVVSFSGPPYIGDIGSANDAKQEIGLSSSAANVKSAISNITTYYGTNIQAGFLKAKAILQSTGRQNANKVIVLLTDGVATCSIGNSAGPNEPISHNAHTRAAYAAGQSCWDTAMVFTVGLLDGVPSKSKAIARQTLEWAQNAGYYDAATAENLETIYDEISSQLGYSATNAVVTDVIDGRFELVADSLAPTPNASVTYDATTQTITWKPGTITNLATLKYKVRAKAGVMGNDVPTNTSAILQYTDINGTPDKEKVFPQPKVNVIGVKVVATPDTTIVIGDEIQVGVLEEYGYGPFQYHWTDSQGWISNDKSPGVMPEEDTTYTLEITDINGCKASDSVSVIVKKGKIIIKKVVLSGSYGPIDIEKDFVINLRGPHGKEWNALLKHQETAQIGSLRPGSYIISELVPMDYKLMGIVNSNFELSRDMILRGDVVTVTVTNKKVNDSWFRDEDEKDNFFFNLILDFESGDDVPEDAEPTSVAYEGLEAILPEREETLEAPEDDE